MKHNFPLSKKMATTTIESDNSHKNSKAGQIIGSNYDLTIQILLCIPARSISNLKLTSKLWLSISTDPSFTRIHNLHYPPSLSGFFLHHFNPATSSSYEYIPIEPTTETDSPTPFLTIQNSLNFKILHSCNGLLLCSSNPTHNYVYICNPTTLQRRKIRLPDDIHPSDVDYGLNIAFDPKISPHYKIVCLRRCRGYQVDVYSSITGQWKATRTRSFQSNVLSFWHGVYCRGAIHWLTSTTSCLYFDIEQQQLKKTPEPLPGMRYSSRCHKYFGQSNGHLYFVVTRSQPNFTIFRMEDDYSGWSIKYVVHWEFLAKYFPIIARSFDNTRFSGQYECNVLSIVETERASRINEWDLELVLSMPAKLAIFNLRTNSTRKIIDSELQPHIESNIYTHFPVYQYFETTCFVS